MVAFDLSPGERAPRAAPLRQIAPIMYGRAALTEGERGAPSSLVAVYRESTMPLLGRRAFLARRFIGGRTQRWSRRTFWIDARFFTRAPERWSPIVPAPGL